MVLFYLSKFLDLLVDIQSCPIDVPRREEKLFDSYNNYKITSEEVVAVKVDARLEHIREKNFDEETILTQKKILKEIVRRYTDSKLELPVRGSKMYLIAPIRHCQLCDGRLKVKPRRYKEAIIYSLTGSYVGDVYLQECSSCKATVYPSYSEFYSDGGCYRKYHDGSYKFFSITSETFFDTLYLEHFCEDLFTCHSRISHVVEKYNRLSGKFPLKLQRVLPAFLMFAIKKRLGSLQFPVLRNKFRSLDTEQIFKFIYPTLRRTVDSIWLNHECSRCATRVCVMDGAQKIYRTVCAAKPTKVTIRGSLNQFNDCINSPLPGQRFCHVHLNDQYGETEDQLDHGVMTRSKRKELGIDVDFLISPGSCRKPEAVTTR